MGESRIVFLRGSLKTVHVMTSERCLSIHFGWAPHCLSPQQVSGRRTSIV